MLFILKNLPLWIALMFLSTAEVLVFQTRIRKSFNHFKDSVEATRLCDKAYYMYAGKQELINMKRDTPIVYLFIPRRIKTTFPPLTRQTTL